jgi:hypothetical protein
MKKTLNLLYNNYILITDIGRDTDDTLALLILLYLHKLSKINLKAIAVSGAKLDLRANCIYYWLNKFKIYDISVILGIKEDFVFEPIDIDEKTKKIIKDNDSNVCVLPYNEKTTNINKLKKNIKSYTNLTEFINNNHCNDINIISIAPIRPLYNVLKKNNNFIKNISNIYFQGNAYYCNNEIIPDIRPGGKGAYNFGNGFPNSEEIKNETKYVIDLFQKHKNNIDNKLYFLGKNTAYLIEFNKNDFLKIGKNIADISIRKTILFAKNLPHVFNLVFKNNINVKKKISLVKKYNKRILNLIENKNSVFNNDIKYIENRLKHINKSNEKKINYLNNLLKSKHDNINNILTKNENYYDSVYNIYIEYLVNPYNINNKYTKDFLSTITKISNPYDLVLTYLVLFKEFFDFDKSQILNENDTIHIDKKNIHFNEKNNLIFKKYYNYTIKKHMLKLLNLSIKMIS